VSTSKYTTNSHSLNSPEQELVQSGMATLTMSTAQEYLTVEETATQLGVNVSAVRRWLRVDQANVFPGARRSTAWRGWRIPQNDVEALKRLRK
jgi:hypothetical protein